MNFRMAEEKFFLVVSCLATAFAIGTLVYIIGTQSSDPRKQRFWLPSRVLSLIEFIFE